MLTGRGVYPDPGGPLEIVVLLVWKARQTIEFQRSRATMQALLSQKGASQEEIMGAFDDLKNASFPYEKNKQVEEKRVLREQLERAVKGGPVQVTPIPQLMRPKPDHRRKAFEERQKQGIRSKPISDPFGTASSRGRRGPVR